MEISTADRHSESTKQRRSKPAVPACIIAMSPGLNGRRSPRMAMEERDASATTGSLGSAGPSSPAGSSIASAAAAGASGPSARSPALAPALDYAAAARGNKVLQHPPSPSLPRGLSPAEASAASSSSAAPVTRVSYAHKAQQQPSPHKPFKKVRNRGSTLSSTTLGSQLSNADNISTADASTSTEATEASTPTAGSRGQGGSGASSSERDSQDQASTSSSDSSELHDRQVASSSSSSSTRVGPTSLSSTAGATARSRPHRRPKPPAAYVEPSRRSALLCALSCQIESYFTPMSLAIDTHTRTLMKINSGYVPISVMANFGRIASIVGAWDPDGSILSTEAAGIHSLLRDAATLADGLDVVTLDGNGKVIVDRNGRSTPEAARMAAEEVAKSATENSTGPGNSFRSKTKISKNRQRAKMFLGAVGPSRGQGVPLTPGGGLAPGYNADGSTQPGYDHMSIDSAKSAISESAMSALPHDALLTLIILRDVPAEATSGDILKVFNKVLRRNSDEGDGEDSSMDDTEGLGPGCPPTDPTVQTIRPDKNGTWFVSIGPCPSRDDVTTLLLGLRRATLLGAPLRARLKNPDALPIAGMAYPMSRYGPSFSGYGYGQGGGHPGRASYNRHTVGRSFTSKASQEYCSPAYYSYNGAGQHPRGGYGYHGTPVSHHMGGAGPMSETPPLPYAGGEAEQYVSPLPYGHPNTPQHWGQHPVSAPQPSREATGAKVAMSREGVTKGSEHLASRPRNPALSAKEERQQVGEVTPPVDAMAASSRPSSTAGTPPLPPPELANLNFPSLSFDHGSDSDEPEEDGDHTKEVRSQPIIVQTPEARPAVVAAEIDSGSDDSSNDGDEEDVPEAPIPRDVTAGGVDNGSAGSAAIDKEENANKPQPVGYAAALLRSPGSSGLPPPVPPSTKVRLSKMRLAR